MNENEILEKRAWQRMLSGRRLDLLNPDPNDIDIYDIAHGLARVARWNGQTKGAHGFSVAEHSLLVLSLFRQIQTDSQKEWQLAALLHDAPEYVIGDLISPFKAAIGMDYKIFENKLLEAIHLRFGINPCLPQTIARQIKAADQIAAFLEATELAGFTQSEAEKYFIFPPELKSIIDEFPRPLIAQSVERAENLFLSEFHKIVMDSSK